MSPEQLFVEHERWAAGIARSVHRKMPTTIDLDDLIQEAHIALLGFVRAFDPDVNPNFRGAAYRTIHGAILSSIRHRPYREATHFRIEAGGFEAHTESAARDRQQAAMDKQRLEWRMQRRKQLLKAKLERLESPLDRALVEAVLLGCVDPVDAAEQLNLDPLEAARRLRDAVKVLRGRRPYSVSNREVLEAVENGSYVLTQQQLAELKKCSRRTIARRIAHLRAKGLLAARRTDEGNVYQRPEKRRELAQGTLNVLERYGPK